MQNLFEDFYRRIAHVKVSFVRSLHENIDWSQRLIGITGARGVGKTTLLLQHIRKEFGATPKHVLYVSLDNFWFSGNRLFDLASEFEKHGGQLLFLDEVHKYDDWSRELKNI